MLMSKMKKSDQCRPVPLLHRTRAHDQEPPDGDEPICTRGAGHVSVRVQVLAAGTLLDELQHATVPSHENAHHDRQYRLDAFPTISPVRVSIRDGALAWFGGIYAQERCLARFCTKLLTEVKEIESKHEKTLSFVHPLNQLSRVVLPAEEFVLDRVPSPVLLCPQGNFNDWDRVDTEEHCEDEYTEKGSEKVPFRHHVDLGSSSVRVRAIAGTCRTSPSRSTRRRSRSWSVRINWRSSRPCCWPMGIGRLSRVCSCSRTLRFTLCPSCTIRRRGTTLSYRTNRYWMSTFSTHPAIRRPMWSYWRRTVSTCTFSVWWTFSCASRLCLGEDSTVGWVSVIRPFPNAYPTSGNNFSLYLFNGTTCYGKFADDPTVCSTKGVCISENKCHWRDILI